MDTSTAVQKLADYALNVAIGFDQMVNTIALGEPDETISARCWRLRDEPCWGALHWVVDKLFFFQKRHCHQAYLSEIQRKQLPEAYRKQGGVIR
jgi:hypothetical protein